ncbi:AEC family transporter [Limoniibacter endophyticus]|uniref:Permease n=1 Tax=Limoniibacter endophyticus TaxID=1565040 RepID=A0A8J3DS29_9HYPH|nr:AEC family transporter [Limoniibacter endophyticus]GHC78504.1 permease [Limoniibacter endophyticus]
MSGLLTILLPTFGLIGLGYAAAQARLLTERASDGLTEYIFVIAIPALIFSTIASSHPSGENPWGYWISYFSGVAVAWISAIITARRVFGRNKQTAAIHGFAAAQSNTVLVGVPVILNAYGNQGATPLFLLLAIHLPIMMTVASILIETSVTGTGRIDLVKRLAKTIFTHPIVLALIAGYLAKVTAFAPSGQIKDVLDTLAATASPCALISMGLALKRYGLKGDVGPVLSISFQKLLVHPFIVWVLAFHVLHVQPVWAGVAVLFAAMPSGVNAYLIAARYKSGERATSAAIALSTALSIFTVSLWLWVLGVV